MGRLTECEISSRAMTRERPYCNRIAFGRFLGEVSSVGYPQCRPRQNHCSGISGEKEEDDPVGRHVQRKVAVDPHGGKERSINFTDFSINLYKNTPPLSSGSCTIMGSGDEDDSCRNSRFLVRELIGRCCNMPSART